MTSRKCTIDNCDRKHEARGYCSKHYWRLMKNGNPHISRARKRGTCSIEGCQSLHIRKGYCQYHYLRFEYNGDPLKGRPYRRGDIQKFVEKAINSSTNECIIWPFKLSTDTAYPNFTKNGRKHVVSRYVLEATVGPPKNNKQMALHAPIICHNKKCINPKHLRWGDDHENYIDKTLDGTVNRGERHGISKLTQESVLYIRKSSMQTSVLAKLYGVSASTICDIKSRRTWAWLP